MSALLPPAPRTELPTDLTAYAPGRIVAVAPERWTVPATLEPSGVLIELPRYALDLRARRTTIEPERVRALMDGATLPALGDRPVHLTMHRAVLHVVRGHHVLAAHLASGTERIPVVMHRPTVTGP
jgi:hypothetical protein